MDNSKDSPLGIVTSRRRWAGYLSVVECKEVCACIPLIPSPNELPRPTGLYWEEIVRLAKRDAVVHRE